MKFTEKLVTEYCSIHCSIFAAAVDIGHNIFEESTSLDGLVQKIMLDAQDVLQCDRCCVFLVDEDTDGVIFNYM